MSVLGVGLPADLPIAILDHKMSVLGGRSARSTKFELIYISCFASQVFSYYIQKT